MKFYHEEFGEEVDADMDICDNEEIGDTESMSSSDTHADKLTTPNPSADPGCPDQDSIRLITAGERHFVRFPSNPMHDVQIGYSKKTGHTARS